MNANNKEVIGTALDAVFEKHAEYTPLHEEYLKAMQTSGAYEPVPEYTPAPGEKVTPSDIIAMLASGELTTKGRDNAVAAGKIRKITAKKSEALIAAEAALNGALEEYHKSCSAAVALISVKKTGARKSGAGSTEHGEVGAQKQADVTTAIHAMDSGATVTFAGRRVVGTLSSGASFDYDVYGQSYLQSIAKMLPSQ